ncbi:N-6 DNA methylase [Ligilactobacillus agilis]|uniref:site-specific DNA-methyltransferase (adenine-specific) n=1 Tax=Ligilactobacillus agilis TaxID=1601 RepID=A0A9Q9MNV3_9LACO|nr:N-6 DNA methylase [Ligilactobacillus agilis]UXC62716.1 N-6 DNA methylase [Ligilactobacillus agilis]UXC64716.1 N-6 DNA methylase [Ligilactobacillus agilis]
MDIYTDYEVSETNTENLFREFYGPTTFIEKSAIPDKYKFKSKKGTQNKGYPDFFWDSPDFSIIVEAKALKHSLAEKQVKSYMLNNSINKNIIGIAISGQELSQVKLTYFYTTPDKKEIQKFHVTDKFVSIENLKKILNKHLQGENISDDKLLKILKNINEHFNQSNVKDTQRSLLFSGMLIALTNANFRSIYKSIDKPSEEEIAKTEQAIPESICMSEALLNAINIQLKNRVNNLSKKYSWIDQFSFIRNVEFNLDEYKNLLDDIYKNIYLPFQNEEKQDLLGRAYKVFLSRSGKIENKNIILTPDHIKSLMVKLARLTLDDVVLDTCTGTGGFLMEAMEKLNNLAKDDELKLEEIRNHRLIGFEIDPTLFALSCSNMFLHGDGRSNVLYRDSLLEKNTKQKFVNQKDEVLYKYIKKQKPTKCIINPPYENNNSIKFAQQAIDYLETNGKLIIIMPSPTLTKNQETGLTEKLLKNARLDYVIKMPLQLFSEQGRTVNTSIFGFTKTPHEEDDEVLFYNLKEDGLVSIQHKGRIDKYNKWNDYENNVLSAIKNSKEIQGVSKKKLIFKNGKLNCAGFDKSENGHNMLKIKELFNLTKGTLASSKANPDGKYNFITAASEWKKSDYYDQKGPALVYATSASGSLGKSQYVDGKFVASNLCYVMKPNEDYKINLKFYNWYFSAIREQIVSDLADGTSKLTISEKSLSEYYIEYFDIEVQNNFVNEYVSKYDKLKNDLLEAEEAVSSKINEMI